MQLSSRLIKGNIAKSGESKVISTEYTVNHANNIQNEEDSKKEISNEDLEKMNVIDPEEMIKEYEVVAQRIIDDAKREKDKILSDSYENATNIEKDAYKKGYDQGQKNGYDDGFQKAYDETIEKAKQQASEIIEKAEDILKSAQDQYGEYLKKRKKDIIDLALNIASTIARERLTTDDGMNNLVEEAFKLSKGEESMVIKVNKVHIEKLKENIDKWKVAYDIKNEIFILEDTFLEPGNAVIEKTSGIIKVGIDSGLSEIKKALIG